MHEKIDMGRMATMWVHGGLSVDMDMLCLRPLDYVLDYIAPDQVGINDVSVGPLVTALAAAYMGHFGRPFWVMNNAMWLLPQARCPVLLDMIRSMVVRARRHYAEWATAADWIRINHTWGPLQVGLEVAKRRGAGVTIFPQPFLEHGAVAVEHCKQGTGALCHVNEYSWVPDGPLKMGCRLFELTFRRWHNRMLNEGVVMCVLGALVGALVCLLIG